MGIGATVLCGREDELAVLGAASERATARTQVVLLRGDAGIGKSRLAGEWARDFRARGGTPCFGYCFDFVGQPPPLAGVIAALREMVSGLTPAARERVVAYTGGRRFAALLPELRSARAKDGAPPTAEHVYDTVLRAVSAAARESRLAIVLEDVHWADALTLDVVANLVHSLRSVPVLFVLTCRGRTSDLGRPFEGALAQMSSLEHATTLTLQPLGDEDIQQQLAALLASDRQDAVTAITRRSGGNPFYAEQLAIACELGLPALPDRLVESLRARLRPLSAPAVEVVRACAAYSGSIHHELLAVACDMSPDKITQAVRETLTNGIVVRSGGGYQISHDLFREVIATDEIRYETLNRHRRIATTLTARPELCLEGPYAQPAVVARHWREAGDAPAAFAAALTAAATAESLAAYGDAYDQVAVALDTWDRFDDAEQLAGGARFELCRRAARLAMAAARVDEGRAMFERAIAELPADVPDATRAALLAHLAVVERDFDGTDHSETLVERAETLVGDTSNADACDALAALAKVRIRQSRLREGARLARRAVAIGRREALSDELATALVCLGAALGFEGDSPAAHRAIAEASATAQRAQNHELEHWARYTDITVHNTEEHFDTALELSQQLMDDIVEERTGPLPMIRLLGILGEIYANMGDLDCLKQTVDRMRQCPFDRGWHRHIEIADAKLMIARGELTPAATVAERLVTHVGPSPDPQVATAVFQLQAEVRRRGGDLAGARRAIDRGLECALRAEDRMYRRETLLEALRIEDAIATACRVRRDHRALDQTIARATTLAANATTRDAADLRYHHAIDAYTERVATGGDAHRFAGSACEFEKAPRALDALELRITEAEIRLSHGDRAHATHVMRDAHARAVAIGAKHLSRVLEDLANRARIRLGPSSRIELCAASGLTARELDVLNQMARGLTNRQVSAVLFIGHRTVGTHVSSILAKLGARTRGEAVARAREAGMFD